MSETYYLNRILGLICSVFDAYSAVLFLPREKSKYDLAAYFSIGDNVREQCSLEPGQGLVGWIIRNNQPILINDYDRQKAWLGYYTPETEVQIKSFMGCPLSNGEGALCIDNKTKYSFSTKDQKILHQFSQLIETLRNDIYEQSCREQEQRFYLCLKHIRHLRKKHHNWASFLDEFLKILADYTNFSHCFFASRDERGKGYYLEGWNRPVFSGNSKHGRKFNFEGGLIGWVFRHNSYVSTANDSPGPFGYPVFDKRAKTTRFQSVACLPISFSRRTRGVLVLADENSKCISKEMENFLGLVADHFTLFLENLYLRNRLRKATHDTT
jgi:transcriptional regulator with GAF, ATPase, and Fis domain